MKAPIHPLFARLLPFLIIGILIILFVLSIFVFSYVLIFMIVCGFISAVVGFIRSKFKPTPPPTAQPTPSDVKGRIIEHDKEE